MIQKLLTIDNHGFSMAIKYSALRTFQNPREVNVIAAFQVGNAHRNKKIIRLEVNIQ